MAYTEGGNVLLKYRTADKLSIRGQAKKIGLGASYLCDISSGNRNMTINVLKKICTAYKYKLAKEDFLTLATECFDTEVIRRFKIRTHSIDDIKAIKDLIFIMTGENL